MTDEDEAVLRVSLELIGRDPHMDEFCCKLVASRLQRQVRGAVRDDRDYRKTF